MNETVIEVTVKVDGKSTPKGQKLKVYRVSSIDNVRGWYDYENMGGFWDDKKFYSNNEVVLPKGVDA